MVSLVSLLVAKTFAFPGGDLASLTQALSDEYGVPSIALVQSAHPLRPFEMDLAEFGDGKDLNRLLRGKAHLESMAKDGGVAIWEQDWADSTVENLVVPLPAPPGMKVVRPAEDWLKDGTISIRLRPGEVICASDLATLPWSKPLRFHWFPARLWIAASAKAVPEKTFLKMLAAALCGQMADKPDEWEIDLAPQGFRTRALATIERRPLGGDTPKLASIRRTLTEEAWRDARDDEITQLFSAPNRIGGWREVISPKMTGLARQYLSAQWEFVSSRPADMKDVTSAIESLLRQIDPNKAVSTGIGQSIGASFLWPRRGGGSILL